MTRLKPKKINVTYIASGKQPKQQADDADAIKKALQQKSDATDGDDCPFC